VQSRLLLVSNVGFAQGWIPGNIVALRNYLLHRGYCADLAFYSVEFSDFIAENYPELTAIDSVVGEWECCFHELYFAGKCFGHEDPLALVTRALDLQREYKDIFEYALLPELRAKVSKTLLAGLRKTPNPRAVYYDRVLKYCKLLEGFLSMKLEQLWSGEYDLVGFSCNNAQFYVSYWFAQRLLSCRRSTRVIFGGPLFTEWNIDQYRRCFPDIYAFVAGRGEETLVEILEKVGVPQECASQGHNPVIIGEAPKANPQEMIVSAYSPISALVRDSRVLWTFQAWLSRNCSWGRCEFCADALHPHSVRDVDETVREIECLQTEIGASRIGFAEPDVNGAKGQFHELVSKLAATKHRTPLWCELNARNTSKMLLAKMRDAGFEGFQVGVEALSNRLLRKMNKPSTVLDNIKVLKWSRDLGIPHVHFNLIYLFPGEDEIDLIETQAVLKLIPHLLAPPWTVRLAEFELLRPAPIYTAYSQNNRIEDYEFFIMALPESLRSQIPFWRRKPNSIRVNPLWRQIAESIHTCRNRRCSLTWQRDGAHVVVEDLRYLKARMFRLDRIAGDILEVLNDNVITTDQLISKFGKPAEAVTKALDELKSHDLLYSEGQLHISLVNNP